MRPLLTVAAAALLVGCASNEYSKVPEPQGEWVPANPPSLMAQSAPAAAPKPVRAVWHPRPRVNPARPVRPAAPPVNTAAAQ